MITVPYVDPVLNRDSIEEFIATHGDERPSTERPFRLALARNRSGGLSVGHLSGYLSFAEVWDAKTQIVAMKDERLAKLQSLPAIWEATEKRLKRMSANVVERYVAYDESSRKCYGDTGLEYSHSLHTFQDSSRLEPALMRDARRDMEMETSL